MFESVLRKSLFGSQVARIGNALKAIRNALLLKIAYVWKDKSKILSLVSQVLIGAK